MKITLIRHPQTEANERKLIYGKTDYSYTLKGQEQYSFILDYIAKIYLNNDQQKKKIQLITSPSRRTHVLATAIGHLLSVDVYNDLRVSEMNFGIFEGLTMEEAKTQYPEAYTRFQYSFSTTTIPEGESYGAFSLRVKAVINEIVEHRGLWQGVNNESVNEWDEIVIVTHGAVIREFLEQVLKLGEGSSWKFVIGNGSVLKLDLSKGNFRVSELIANPYHN